MVDIVNEDLTNIIDFWEKLSNVSRARVKFIKKTNGEVRIMNCTLDNELIPENSRPKKIDMSKILKLIRKNRIIKVYDIDKNGWRSIPFDNTEWIETSDKRYKVKPIKT